MANTRKKSPTRYEDRDEGSSALMKYLAAIVCFGVAVLTAYVCFTVPQVNTVTGSISSVLRGIGGSLGVVLGLVFVWIGVLFLCSARGKKVRVWRVLMNGLLFLCLFTAVELFSVKDINAKLINPAYIDFIRESYAHQAGGGMLGAFLAWPLYTILGTVGGLIAVILLAIVSLTATGRTQKVVHWAQDRAADRKVERAEREAEEEKRRREREEREARIQRAMPRGERMPSREERVPVRDDRRGASRPVRRNLEQEVMVLGNPVTPDTPVKASPDPGKTKGRPAAAKAAAPKKTSNSKKMYEEIVDPDAAPKKKKTETNIDIPKSLNKLREEKKTEEVKPVRRNKIEDIEPEVKPAAPVVNVAEEAVDEMDDDIFRVRNDEPEDIEEFAPTNYSTPKVKPKTVVEGVHPLKLDDDEDEDEQDDTEEAAEDIDEPPFDIPLTRSLRRPEPKKPEEIAAEDEYVYNYPPIDLLEEGEQVKNTKATRSADMEKAETLMETLRNFGIETKLTDIAHGPAVTRFELQPAAGVKVSRITSLTDDIALRLAAESIRIEAPIPGKAAVGVEIPNDKVEMVRLRDVLECPDARHHSSKVAVGLGKSNDGRYVIADIAKMPHVLIAGQTGSGKSVCINSIITSVLYRATPDEVRMILIDPKVVELSIYNEIPHLIAPVVTDPKKAASALQWAVCEMEHRYKLFADLGVRDIKGYNKEIVKKEGEKPLPQMLIVIDELADLMMVAPGEVEDSICRIAQLARACGMHLVIATQRPSVNVITGIIKANIPTRIAFAVASQIDSRTMIDHAGAEKLLGHGDMLFVPSGLKPVRVQGAWVSDEEVHSIVTYIKARSESNYDQDVQERIENSVRSDAEKEEVASEYDDKLVEAIEIVIEAGQASTSMLQRRMRVGYARAGRLIDEMEQRGIVSEADGSKPRNVLISREQFKAMFPDE